MERSPRTDGARRVGSDAIRPADQGGDGASASRGLRSPAPRRRSTARASPPRPSRVPSRGRAPWFRARRRRSIARVPAGSSSSTSTLRPQALGRRGARPWVEIQQPARPERVLHRGHRVRHAASARHACRSRRSRRHNPGRATAPQQPVHVLGHRTPGQQGLVAGVVERITGSREKSTSPCHARGRGRRPGRAARHRTGGRGRRPAAGAGWLPRYGWRSGRYRR